MSEAADNTRHRLDKWLWHTRFFKTRGLASDAVAGGHAKVNGERVKASRELRVGDLVTVTRGEETVVVQVLTLPSHRGPAPAAQACYSETPESAALRLRLREQRKLADQSRPRPDTRPDKRDRRLLEQLRRQQG
ncbi:MAG: hypothetical protein RL026_1928 [Pseudomonadota bacterium]